MTTSPDKLAERRKAFEEAAQLHYWMVVVPYEDGGGYRIAIDESRFAIWNAALDYAETLSQPDPSRPIIINDFSTDA